ncbi:hypothetical protein [Geodermatophilus nigrescens]|uniref:Uncharacterized protein n=1 Tax=Geodermatophilus nigrescens TaxID=1070870 RepID=A0A1M5NB07_9ACTN|nr:hypothetical protein [Geodermatophilus nigrescens]SHG86796.1 hypothetical protein SAMN05444351_3485 [Geodermatophilus nigrescens]
MTRSTTARRSLAAVTLAAVCALPACSSQEGTDEAGASSSATSAAAESPSAPDEETAEVTDAPAEEEAGEPVVTDAPVEDTSVAISNAYWDPAEAALFAYGFVSPVVEDGGTCTLLVSRDGATVRATVDGMADATTTVCDRLVLPGEELSPGTWSVVLQYESGSASGESAPYDVEVPE